MLRLILLLTALWASCFSLVIAAIVPEVEIVSVQKGNDRETNYFEISYKSHEYTTLKLVIRSSGQDTFTKHYDGQVYDFKDTLLGVGTIVYDRQRPTVFKGVLLVNEKLYRLDTYKNQVLGADKETKARIDKLLSVKKKPNRLKRLLGAKPEFDEYTYIIIEQSLSDATSLKQSKARNHECLAYEDAQVNKVLNPTLKKKRHPDEPAKYGIKLTGCFNAPTIVKVRVHIDESFRHKMYKGDKALAAIMARIMVAEASLPFKSQLNMAFKVKIEFRRSDGIFRNFFKCQTLKSHFQRFRKEISKDHGARNAINVLALGFKDNDQGTLGISVHDSAFVEQAVVAIPFSRLMGSGLSHAISHTFGIDHDCQQSPKKEEEGNPCSGIPNMLCSLEQGYIMDKHPHKPFFSPCSTVLFCRNMWLHGRPKFMAASHSTTQRQIYAYAFDSESTETPTLEKLTGNGPSFPIAVSSVFIFSGDEKGKIEDITREDEIGTYDDDDTAAPVTIAND